jgi:hypothetical protein
MPRDYPSELRPRNQKSPIADGHIRDIALAHKHNKAFVTDSDYETRSVD